MKVPTPLRAIILCSAAALLLPAAANAAARYAVPTGGVSSGNCPVATPCTLRFAVEGAFGNRPSDGDDVRLAAGEYTENSKLTVYYRLNISGPDGVYSGATPWAFIIFPAFADGGEADNVIKFHLAAGSGGSRIERIAMTGKAVNTQLVNAATEPRSTFDRVQLFVRGADSIGLAGSGLTVSNTLISQTSTDTFGVAAAMTGSITGSSIRSDNGTAIRVDNGSHSSPDCALDVRNTIATGGAHNAQVERVPPSFLLCTSVSMAISNSWIPASGTGGGLSVVGAPNATMTFGLGNLAATPAITDDTAFNGNWLFGPASPVINAGCTFGCGTTDMYGRPRPIGPANDIGAGESTLAPVVATPSVSDIATGGATVAVNVNPAYAVTSYTVQYRPQGAGTYTSTAPLDAGSGVADQLASVRIDGLAPATAYHVRVVATNSVGTTTGTDARFTTTSTASGSAGAALPVALPATLPAALVAKWSRTRRTVRAIVTPAATATGYRMSAVATKGKASTRKGRCVAAKVKGAKRQRCTITLPKGRWSVTVQGRKGPAVVAAATRVYAVK